jgi:methionine-rich copper-binding protein CopC
MSRAVLVRVVGSAALALALGLTGASAAAGHASQTGSTPAADAVVDTAPSVVDVSFDTPLMDIGAALVVRSEDGTVVSDPVPVVERTRIQVAVEPDAPPGVYAVAYRVVSQDGHPITSTFEYTVAGEPPSAPATSAPAEAAPAAVTAVEEPDGPPYALIAGGLLALTLLVAGAIALRR